MKLSIVQAYGLFCEVRSTLLKSGYLTLDMKKEIETARLIDFQGGWKGATLEVRNINRDYNRVSLQTYETHPAIEVMELYQLIRQLNLLSDEGKVWLHDVIENDDEANKLLIEQFHIKLEQLADKIKNLADDYRGREEIHELFQIGNVTFACENVYNGHANVARWVFKTPGLNYIVGNPADE